MNVLHVPYCFYPDPVGGTEVYVEGLARRQQAQGMTVAIAAPAGRNASYVHNGLSVHRYQVNNPVPDLRDLYGEGDRGAVQSFAPILALTSPDLVHLHAFTSGVSLRLIRSIKTHGIPVALTYHTPTVSCSRGTLLQWGREICDGRLEVRRCARCVLNGQGLNPILSWIAGSVPAGVGERLGARGLAGGVWTAARMGELMALRQETFRAMTREVDHVIAVCEWVKELLIRNGVDPDKITLSRQGVSAAEHAGRPASGEGSPVRLAFLGRLNKVKGLDILIEAIAQERTLALTLDVYGVAQDAEGERISRLVSRRVEDDGRIRLLPPVSPHEVVPTLKKYDCLVVPSQWLETGPLVIYEAFAAGIPVVGSNLGGIAELVTDGRNGLLVEPRSVEAWTSALRRLCTESGLVDRLKSGIGPVRTMDSAAAEMLPVYKTLLERSGRSRAWTLVAKSLSQ